MEADLALKPVMPYSCQACSKRKVRCDKMPHPQKCSACCKSGLDCVYPTAPFAKRQRKSNTTTTMENARKIRKYERILQQHGLFDDNEDRTPPVDDTANDDTEVAGPELVLPTPTQRGTQKSRLVTTDETNNSPSTLLTGHGQTRFVDLNHWHSLGDDLLPHMSDDEAFKDDDEESGPGYAAGYADPFSAAAFAGNRQNLVHHHPSHEEAMWLWKMHVERVEPTYKLLHVPSTTRMIQTVSADPTKATRSQECLMFAIYHFALTTVSEAEYNVRFRRESHSDMLKRLRVVCERALVNVGWLQSRKVIVLQAIVLFLLPCRHFYDPQLYWILTGAALRIAQRIGIHRDGVALGLSPYDTQLRRLLFNQVVPLDGMASSMAGTRLAPMPPEWDSKMPWNINDDQIWPEMTEPPVEKDDATELVFCLTRASLGFASVRVMKMKAAGASQEAISAVIDEVEKEIHQRFVQHCDMIDPLHFLTVCMSRAGIYAMRLKPGLARIRNRTATSVEKREIFDLSQTIMDIDIAAHVNMSLPRFRWQAQSSFTWGLWDALTYTLLTIGSRSEALTGADVDAAWARIQRLYETREPLRLEQVLHVAIGRLVIKAWDANPSSDDLFEPEYINALKSLLGRPNQIFTVQNPGQEHLHGTPLQQAEKQPPLDIMDFLTEDFHFDSNDPDFHVQWLSGS